MSGVMRAHHKEVLGMRCWLEEVGYGVMVMLVSVECGRIGGRSCWDGGAMVCWNAKIN